MTAIIIRSSETVSGLAPKIVRTFYIIVIISVGTRFSEIGSHSIYFGIFLFFFSRRLLRKVSQGRTVRFSFHHIGRKKKRKT